MKRGGSLDIPRGIRPVGQVVESPSSVHKMFSEPQVRITSKMDDYDQCQSGNESVSSDTFQFEALPPVIKSVKKSDKAQGCSKQVGVKVQSEDAVPTFTQKLTLAHRRRLGMAKQWSMDETQSWFRQEIEFVSGL